MMRKLFPLLILLMAALPVSAQAQSNPAAERMPSVDLPTVLDRVLRDYERAWGGGDAAALAR
jgi:hypothetical protein